MTDEERRRQWMLRALLTLAAEADVLDPGLVLLLGTPTLEMERAWAEELTVPVASAEPGKREAARHEWLAIKGAQGRHDTQARQRLRRGR